MGLRGCMSIGYTDFTYRVHGFRLFVLRCCAWHIFNIRYSYVLGWVPSSCGCRGSCNDFLHVVVASGQPRAPRAVHRSRFPWLQPDVAAWDRC